MSLTREDLEDIKQLMEAVMSAAIKEQDEKFEKRFKKIDERFDQIDGRFEKIDERFDEVLNAIGSELNDINSVTSNHETRITRLEKAAA